MIVLQTIKKSISKLMLSTVKRTMSFDILKDIFLKSVESVHPQSLVKNCVKQSTRHLIVKNDSYPISKPCHMVGFGKAVLGMALEMERILEGNLQRAVVTVPSGIFNTFPLISPTNIEFIEGAENNIPDKRAMEGAQKIRDLAATLDRDDLLICLISGGGSALLPLPEPPVTLQEKQKLIVDLSQRGANISELNCVRKQISILKGGGLAAIASPATVISLVLSDIIDDPLDYIASGPTTLNVETHQDALNILKKYLPHETIPQSIREVLESPEKAVNGNFDHARNYIIGNNEIAAQTARDYAISKGFQSAIISTGISGDVARISQIYADLAGIFVGTRQGSDLFPAGFCARLHSDAVKITNFDRTRPTCLVAAGEPTVLVGGGGKGGRNQQLALALSMQLDHLDIKSTRISFLSAGTDGIDGPTDAAGAIGTWDLVKNCVRQNIRADDFLMNCDSYTFFSRYNDGFNHIKIGHTGTNVMDIHLLLIEPRT